MKRKVGLFLLAVMVAVSLGATIVASLAMYRLVSEKQAEEIHKLEASLSDRFAVFEDMLRSEHVRITDHMEKVLPQIAAELESLGRQPGDLSVAELDALASKYGVQHIYFIDRAHKVFQTNLAYDMNLIFPKGEFTRFLDSVYGAGKVMNDGIDLSQVTGTLQHLQLLRSQGEGLHHRDLDRRARQHLPPGRLRLDEQVLLRGSLHRRRALESLRQGRRHLPDQRRRHLVADPCRREARSRRSPSASCQGAVARR